MVLEKVKDILVEQFDADKDAITLETSFADDLQADSLDLVDLVMSIEDAFDIEVEDDATKDIATVGDLVSYIEERI